MKHLASSTITARLRAGTPPGLPATARLDGDSVSLNVAAAEVGDVLRLLLDADAVDVTCTSASLDEIFLQHYRVGAR